MSIATRTLTSLALGCLIGLPTIGHAQRLETHEMVIDELFPPMAGSGFVNARSCEECPLQRLPLNSDTRYFFAGSEIDAEQARAFRGHSGMIQMDVERKRVTHVRVQR
jgi:hypothetical protein